MLGKTLDGEFKLLRIRELDNDDVDVKRDSTDEDSPPNFSICQRVVVQCGADIGCIGSTSILATRHPVIVTGIRKL